MQIDDSDDDFSGINELIRQHAQLESSGHTGRDDLNAITGQSISTDARADLCPDRSVDSECDQPEKGHIRDPQDDRINQVENAPIPGAREKPFNLHSRHILLTYPRTKHDEGRQAVLSVLNRVGAERYLVGFENHQDGSEHIHVYIDFQRKRHFRDVRAFDIECGCKHPNVVTCRSYRGAIRYVTKDGRFDHAGFSEAEIDDIKAPRRSRNRPASSQREIGKRLIAGERIETIASDYPELVVNSDLVKLRNNAIMVRAYNPELVKRVIQQVQIFNLTYYFNPELPCRNGGNYHLWLYGEPGSGKSTIFTNLANQYRIYSVSDGANWAGFDSDLYDAILFDECTPETLTKTTFSVLNTIMDGRPYHLNSKGGAGGAGHQKFDKKMPIFFCSNWNVMNMTFKDNVSFPAFMSRLMICELKRDKTKEIFTSECIVLPNPYKL